MIGIFGVMAGDGVRMSGRRIVIFLISLGDGMSSFEKAFKTYKADLALNMVKGGESSRLPAMLERIDQQRDLAEAMFEAGVQSTGVCNHIWQHIQHYKGSFGSSLYIEEYEKCVLCGVKKG